VTRNPAIKLLASKLSSQKAYLPYVKKINSSEYKIYYKKQFQGFEEKGCANRLITGRRRIQSFEDHPC